CLTVSVLRKKQFHLTENHNKREEKKKNKNKKNKDSPSNKSLISLAACMPSSLRFRSIKRLLAAAALSSALCAQPIVRIASTQNVLKVVYIGHNWPNTNTHEEIQKTETKV
ncbi:hypothetical protein DOY81_011101, partial [Sarcophaga bullata]